MAPVETEATSCEMRAAFKCHVIIACDPGHSVANPDQASSIRWSRWNPIVDKSVPVQALLVHVDKFLAPNMWRSNRPDIKTVIEVYTNTRHLLRGPRQVWEVTTIFVKGAAVYHGSGCSSVLTFPGWQKLGLHSERVPATSCHKRLLLQGSFLGH